MAIAEYTLSELSDRIRSAIAEELKVSSAGRPFKVTNILKQDGVLRLEVEPLDLRCGLDESMEDGSLGWHSETSGYADVISVLPDISYVNALMTSGRSPRKGSIVFINPAPFLEPLVKLWDRRQVAEGATRRYFELEAGSHNPQLVPSHSRVSTLRPAQVAAFQLVGWNTSYLWGPPGTGKTSTVGWLLASYLCDRPIERVLLLSTTNVAVDLAILSVDKAIPEVFGAAPNPSCLRFGSRFDPKSYRGRDHLIPVRDTSLLERYEEHLHTAPDPAEAEKYLVWKNGLELLRHNIRDQNYQFLKTARLAAMTATYATFHYDELVEVGPFDLVVFDEASQVGKAHAMTLAGLGKRVMFAGDPKQLSPIVQAKSEAVSIWLGQSAFEWASRSSLRKASCMLDEQWRMAEPISRVVSDLFYDSRLKVAAPAQNNPEWLAARSAGKTLLLERDNIVLVDLGVRARTAHKFIGYCCPESAEVIAALTVDLRTSRPDQNILILTPYRAQRHEVRKQLRSINAPVAWASTVHHAQGSQCPVVIFDPVCPSSEFVGGAEGMRLMNVALSRAECRLIVLMQSDWIENAALKHLVSKFRPVRLDPAKLARLLNQKLPRVDATQVPTEVAPRSVAKPAPKLQTLADRFEEELFRGLTNGPNTTAFRRQFFRDLARRSAYSGKVTYAEMDAAMAAVSSRLPLP